jgi:hypothetical protein
MAKKPVSKDAYQVPEGILNFTEEKKKEVAREMFHKTSLNNQQVADITGLTLRAVAAIHEHVKGTLKKVNDIKQEHREQGTLAAGEEETAVLDGVPVRLRDIDAKAPQRSPEPLEARVLHLESGLRDMTSRIGDVDARVGNGFEELKEMLATGPRVPAQAAGGNGNGHQALEQAPPRPMGDGQIKGQFEGIKYVIPISSRQVTLFEMWRAKTNKFARIDPEHYTPFEGDIGDLITQLALPEFFKLRGATIKYAEEEMTVEAR